MLGRTYAHQRRHPLEVYQAQKRSLVFSAYCSFLWYWWDTAPSQRIELLVPRPSLNWDVNVGIGSGDSASNCSIAFRPVHWRLFLHLMRLNVKSPACHFDNVLLVAIRIEPLVVSGVLDGAGGVGRAELLFVMANGVCHNVSGGAAERSMRNGRNLRQSTQRNITLEGNRYRGLGPEWREGRE